MLRYIFPLLHFSFLMPRSTDRNFLFVHEQTTITTTALEIHPSANNPGEHPLWTGGWRHGRGAYRGGSWSVYDRLRSAARSPRVYTRGLTVVVAEAAEAATVTYGGLMNLKVNPGLATRRRGATAHTRVCVRAGHARTHTHRQTDTHAHTQTPCRPIKLKSRTRGPHLLIMCYTIVWSAHTRTNSGLYPVRRRSREL